MLNLGKIRGNSAQDWNKAQTRVKKKKKNACSGTVTQPPNAVGPQNRKWDKKKNSSAKPDLPPSVETRRGKGRSLLTRKEAKRGLAPFPSRKPYETRKKNQS